jgi:dihydrofolate synthase / folylpolyglutamate synthase
LIVTRNSSVRSMPVPELAAVAQDYFGEDRVHIVPRMDDAIDRAIGLADESGEFAGAGVLITGSVTTAGDARLLMRAAE